MAINAKKGGNFELAPVGNHVAICYQIIDLGTQRTQFNGKEKLQRKVLFTFELCNELRKFKDDEPEKPFTVSKRYTLSLHEKGKLLPDLESWRGRKFTDEEKAGSDISIFLGKPCMLQIAHENDYANIQAIASIPKGIEKPARVNPVFEFSLDEFTEEKFALLPEFAKKIIADSEEYKKAKGHPAEMTSTDEDIF